MDHLVDTCTLIFFLEDSPRLPDSVARRIEDPASRSLVSLASLWEIAIKSALGKLQVDWSDRPDLPDVLSKIGFEMVTPGWQAMHRAAYLPMHHRDPFDRLLVAESQIRGMPILSCDQKLDAYGVTRIWS
ncbi:type II toxin-antitoxin system VapC family toxin [Luteolibacter flavescens]|uniref:Type II toxin-antitoxin system VapC family toxin n=1 Tax=Luteolibacter flavescens TaxID=1859460 RepID=A0ABT3FI26_9BACT|nr:type II toxin-antitoxin system VapC family toxin [Luteolibacter flavescens]MCW1883223.1 type II toxin-antitoxin system VapC family toxin [Luteolibacter flavescens]